MPAWWAVAARREPLASGNADLLADEVDAEDRLRDRMLDLKPGVHLQKIEVLTGHDELDGSRIAIVHRRRGFDGRLCHSTALRIAEANRGRLFEQLLMPPLNRTVALA